MSRKIAKPQAEQAARNVARATISDVARDANVAIKTVSRVLNNEANVKPATREAVLKVIKALNYSPNLAARGLAGGKSFLIGLLYDNPSPHYMNAVQMGALARCRAEGFHLLVEVCTPETKNVAQQILTMIAQTRVDGVILTPPLSDNAAVMEVLRRDGVPYVAIAPPKLSEISLCVHMDDHRAAYDMTTYLLKLGHKQIGFIKGHPKHGAASFRYNGFRKALADHGIKYDAALVKQGYFSFESGVECARSFLKMARVPTAIFAANDDMAAGAIAAAHQNGLSIPNDLSIAGFDDTPVASLTWPSLTTVHQPIAEMAAAAAELLLVAIKERSRASRVSSATRFPHEIIVRASTTAPRK
ncbi:MAG TPA: LacI family DNA-binding transcriptional regulator [Rhizomicrobium sp.]|jgi:LacI family transcriptional regulator